MGRTKKTVEEHKESGYYRPSRHDFTALEMPKVNDIEMPEGLHKASEIAWDRIIPELLKKELVSVVDAPLLEHAFFCHTYAMMCKDKISANDGDFFELNKLYRANMEEWKAILYKFGVSPMERGKIKAPEKKEKKEDDLSDLIGIKGTL